MVDQGTLVDDYKTGEYTIKQLGEKYGISTGKTYYLLRDAGCEFIRTRRKPFTDKERLQRSMARKGRRLSEQQRRKLSEIKSCCYNGLNGYGHTKQQNTGYVLAYAPKHPHAHKDGYVMLHTVIMEVAIGRYLHDDEVVHHINHDRKDNRLENLQLMTKKEHRSMHMRERHEKRRNGLSIA